MYADGRASLRGSVGSIAMGRHPGRLGEIFTLSVPQPLYMCKSFSSTADQLNP